MQMIGQIELTTDEQELLSKIVFELDHRMEHGEVIENGERAAALTKMLMGRDAIPEHRQRYFMDPEYNPGPGKESRFTYFRNNAGSDRAVLRDPNFLKYLHYFIYGADLPATLKQEFSKKAEDYWVKPDEVAKFAKQLVRKYNLERHPMNYRRQRRLLSIGSGLRLRRGNGPVGSRCRHEGQIKKTGHREELAVTGTPKQDPLAVAFEGDLRQILVNEREIGFCSSRFAQMLDQYGGVETARRLLEPSRELRPNTFTYLRQIDRLDLAMETYVLMDKYAPLFTDEERQIAAWRLKNES